MPHDSALNFMVSWFGQHCDGDWEHDLGIRIETLDNPGWALDVRLGDTELDGITTDWHRRDDSDEDWLFWRSTGETFEARCGPGNLSEALAAFRAFAQEART